MRRAKKNEGRFLAILTAKKSLVNQVFDLWQRTRKWPKPCEMKSQWVKLKVKSVK